MTGIIAELLL